MRGRTGATGFDSSATTQTRYFEMTARNNAQVSYPFVTGCTEYIIRKKATNVFDTGSHRTEAF